jgi:hypothetical protein
MNATSHWVVSSPRICRYATNNLVSWNDRLDEVAPGLTQDDCLNNNRGMSNLTLRTTFRDVQHHRRHQPLAGCTLTVIWSFWTHSPQLYQAPRNGNTSLIQCDSPPATFHCCQGQSRDAEGRGVAQERVCVNGTSDCIYSTRCRG